MDVDSKEKLKKEVESALIILHEKIDSLKEKVDKLCESSGCFKNLDDTDLPKK